MSEIITEEQRSILRHALGAPNAHTVQDPDWPWRNHYCIGPDCDGWQDVQQLVELKFMVKGRTQAGGLIYFHCTEDGKKEALRWL